MKNHVVYQGMKALFGRYTKIRKMDHSIECQFDDLVVPILTLAQMYRVVAIAKKGIMLPHVC